MNWNFLISFGIGLGLYFLGLLVFSLIKRHKNKKVVEKDKADIEGNDNGKK